MIVLGGGFGCVRGVGGITCSRSPALRDSSPRWLHRHSTTPRWPQGFPAITTIRATEFGLNHSKTSTRNSMRAVKLRAGLSAGRAFLLHRRYCGMVSIACRETVKNTLGREYSRQPQARQPAWRLPELHYPPSQSSRGVFPLIPMQRFKDGGCTAMRPPTPGRSTPRLSRHVAGFVPIEIAVPRRCRHR